MPKEKKTPMDLGTAPIGAMMASYSLPCIISLLVAALYNMVDQIFIGWGVGKEGNGATNIVFPVTVFALAIAVMIGDGACSYVSICLGKGDQKRAHETIGNAAVLVLILGVILMGVYLLFQMPILRLFGANDEVSDLTISYAKEYFTVISYGIPFYMFGQALNSAIRSDGSPKIAMAVTLCGAGVNVICDPIAIFVLHMGVLGAAIATVAGQVVTAAVTVLYLTHMKRIRLHRSSFLLHAETLCRFLPLGISSFLTQFSIVLSMAALNNMITKYGILSVFAEGGTADTPLAVQGIVMKFFQIAVSVVTGMAVGCIPIVGYNFGAGHGQRCRQIMKRLMGVEFVIGLLALLAFECFPVQLISLFGTNYSEIYFAFAKLAFRLYFCMIPLDMVCKASFIFLQSIGRPVRSTLLSLLREVVLAIPLAFLLPPLVGELFGMENAVYGLLLSMPVSVVITFVVAAFVDTKTYRGLKDISANP